MAPEALKRVGRVARFATALARDVPVHLRYGRLSATPLSRRLVEQWALLLLNGVTAENYYLCALDRPEVPWARKREFLGDADRWRWQTAFNPLSYQFFTEDKVVFGRYLAAVGVPVPRLLGVIGPNGRAESGEALADPADVARWFSGRGIAQVALKPLWGSGGTGVLVLGDRVGEREWARVPEGRVSLDEILAHVAGDPRRPFFLVQERLRPHPALAELHPEVLHTARVLTVLLDEGVEVVAATLRIGLGRAPVDNLEQGNLGVPIDVGTGRLGAATLMRERIERCRDHPVSGARIEGRRMPGWPEALEILRRAARAVPFNPVLGWDVAFTPGGPCVVEANDQWHPQACQVAQDRGLLGTALGPYLCQRGITRHIGVGLPRCCTGAGRQP
jgi:hypothetical protein